MSASPTVSGLLDRLAAMSMREMLLVGAVVVGGLYLAVDRVSLKPATTRIAAAEAASAASDARIGALNARLQALRSDRGMSELLVTRKRELAELTAQVETIAAIRRSATEQPLTVPQLIKAALKTPNPRVVVDGVKALPATQIAVLEPAAQGESPSALFQQGIDVQVRGGYADLLLYLQGVERDRRLFWSGAQLATVAYPELSLRLTLHSLTTQGTPAP